MRAPNRAARGARNSFSGKPRSRRARAVRGAILRDARLPTQRRPGDLDKRVREPCVRVSAPRYAKRSVSAAAERRLHLRMMRARRRLASSQSVARRTEAAPRGRTSGSRKYSLVTTTSSVPTSASELRLVRTPIRKRTACRARARTHRPATDRSTRGISTHSWLDLVVNSTTAAERQSSWSVFRGSPHPPTRGAWRLSCPAALTALQKHPPHGPPVTRNKTASSSDQAHHESWSRMRQARAGLRNNPQEFECRVGS